MTDLTDITKPLKYGTIPRITAKVGYAKKQPAATVRYDDEKDISEGDWIELQKQDGERWGIGYVCSTVTCPLHDAVDEIADYGAVYSCWKTSALHQKLKKHYGPHIRPVDEVKVIFYSVLNFTNSDPIEVGQ